jgi:hypothetical protein
MLSEDGEKYEFFGENCVLDYAEWIKNILLKDTRINEDIEGEE